MKNLCVLISLATFISNLPQANAVTETAAVFLLLQPSVRANGMGGVSVASWEHEALSAAFNPAHIGLAALNRTFNLELYTNKTKFPSPFTIGEKEPTFEATSVQLGYNLRRIHERLPISFGVGYSKVKMILGEQTITGENSPEPIGTFQISEEADIWTFGIGIDYYFQIGIGYSFKDVASNLATVGAGAEKGPEQVSVNAHDFGIIVQLPVFDALAKLTNKSYEIQPGLAPFFIPGFGYSKSNTSDKGFVYIDILQTDPLPRVARIGMSVNTGLTYSRDKVSLRVWSFEWASEAEDLLVDRLSDGSFRYEGGIGEINFFENVIKSKSNRNVQNRRGWELNLFDIFAIRRGRQQDVEGNLQFKGKGYGLSLKGAVRLAFLLQPELKNNRILNYLNQHLDIRYNSSSFDAFVADKLIDVKYKSLSVSFY